MANTATAEATAPAALPAVLGGVAPYLFIAGAAKAADFYRRAFAAKEVYRHALDDKGRTMDIHLHINGGSVMLSDGRTVSVQPLTQIVCVMVACVTVGFSDPGVHPGSGFV